MAEFTVKLPGRDYCRRAVIENGRLAELARVENTATDLWLTRGLVDIQVNGYRGVTLTGTGLASADLARCEAALAAEGVVRWCPTITTQDPEVIRGSLDAIASAIESGTLKRVHCIHMEANFLSPEEGYRGAHLERFMQDPDIAEFESWQRAARGRIGYVSLAPELKGALDFIGYLTAKGLLVALAHHNASPEQVSQAAEAGARLSTHLFNGSAGRLPRHTNVILSQLAEDRLWASFIPDGHHVPYHLLKMGLRVKGLERSLFTSDLVYLGGMPDGEYTKAERTVEVREGGIWIKGTGYLSGAWRSQAQGIERATAAGVVTPGEALRLASLNPARLLGLPDNLEPKTGCGGPFVLFRECDGALKLDRIID